MKTRLTSRLLALLLVLCMTLSVTVMVSAESVGSVTLGMSVTRSGSNVTAVISAASFTGTGATDIEFNINYDSSKLTYVGETDGDTNLSFAGYCYDRGTFVRCSGSGKALSAAGTLVTLNFTVKDGASGSAQFSMSSAMAISNVDDVDVTPAGAKSIEVADYSVTVGTVTNGTVTVSPSGIVAPGTTVTVTATPNEGYMLDAISVTTADGTAVAVNGNTFTMPSASVTVTATFKAAVYNVTVKQPTNGTLSVDKTSGAKDTEVTITATPNSGFNVGSVTVTDANGKTVSTTKSGDKYTFKMPASDVTVSAEFVGKTYTITKGSVTGGKLDVASSAAYGSTVTVTATPDAGWELVNVTVTSGGQTVATTKNGNQYTFTMPDADVTVNATFKEVVYNVTVQQSSNGTLSVDKTSGTKDTVITITATPSTGYDVESLTVTDANGKTVSVTKSGDKYTFKMPASDVKVSAKFSGKSYAITKGSVTGGKLDVATSAAYGSKVTITATANTGWKLVDVTVTFGGQVIEATKNGNQYTFTMPAGEVKVSATFQECVYTITSGTASNGTYTVSASSAKYGTKININASPVSGYQVASVTVKDANGNKIKVSGSGTAYTFNMPDSNVTVAVTFEKIPANSYKVTVETGEGYAITANKNYATAGATITLTVSADEGYTVTGVSVTSNGKAVSVSGSGETYTFKMPAGNVTVSVQCEKNVYNVSVEETENVKVQASTNSAVCGDSVTLNVVPAEGYSVDTIHVLDAQGNEIAIILNNELYTFTMPASDVTVSVIVKELPTEPTEEPTEDPTVEPTEEQKPTEAKPTEPAVQQDGGDSNNMIIMLLCIALLVVIVAIVIILLARRKKAEPAGAETSVAEDLDE